MTSRTSYWVGLLLCATTAVSGIQLFASAQADTLKITGPNGEVKQANRQYGPTTSADTFWSIAQKVRPNDQVTIYQVMAALFDANPQAFSGNNFNTLERGMILTVPSAEVMAAIPKEQAKLRAERDDSAVRTVVKQTPRPVATPVKVEQAPVPEKPLQIIAQTPAKISEAEPLSAAKQNEIITLNNQLDNANNKTLMLTDELARAQDQLMATRSDNQILKQKLAELTQSIGRLEEDLQLSGEKQAQLIADNEALVIELEEANKPPVEQPTDFWRNLTSNTGLLIAAASLPILLIFGVIALIMRRRSSANTVEPVQTENKLASNTVPSRTDNENGDDLEDLAIHLDGDDEESIDDLLDLDSLEMQSDTDLVIDDDQMDMASEMFLTQAEDEIDVTPEVEEEDEGTSLDDLWAEAMEEQDSELEPLETDEDLDSLLAGLDDEEIDEASPAALEDDLDALLANFDGETDEVDAPAEMLQDDLDALLANLDGETDEVDAPVAAEPEDDLDALLANLDVEPESSSVEDPLADQQDNIDELLAGFDLPDEDASNETASELETKNDVNNSIVDENTADEDDIDSLLASFDLDNKTADKADLSAEIDNEDNDDIDALLASFEADDAPAETEATETEKEIEDLTDAIAAELESDNEADVSEVNTDDDDIDALLASFEADDAHAEIETETESTETEKETEDLANEIAAELESDDEVDANEINTDDDDINALLASFEAEDVPAETEATETEKETEDLANAIAAELESDDEVDANDVNTDDDDINALLASFEADDAPAETEAEATETEIEDLANEIAAELESDDEVDANEVNTDDDDINALLASFEAEDAPAKTEATETEKETEDLANEIAAELESDDEVDANEVNTDDDDINALLASFEAEDTPSETEATETEIEDLANAIAAELESDDEVNANEINTDDDDINALLASFEADDAPAETEAEATETETEDLADAIAAELESDDEVDANEVNTDDDDINALLASFEAEDAKTDQDADVVDELAINTSASTAEITSEAAETETEDMVDAIAAGSESDKGDVSLTEDEFLEFDELPENTPHLDSLLAELESATVEDEAEEFLSFNEDDELDDDDLSNLITELELANETTEQDDLSFNALESELNQAASAEVNSDKNLTKSDDIDDSILADAENELDALLAGMSAEDETLNDELSNDAQELDFYESAFDNTSAQVNSPAEQVTAKAEKDSGFFNDLKAAKKAPADLLDWETDLFNPPAKPAAPTDNLIDNSKDFLVDDEDVDFSVNDDIDFNIDEDEFVLSDDSLTVDEAIAALDAKESKLASPHITEAELSNFERENGFIDINKLLNDADEDDSVASDRYKEIDVDMGEFESLIGNADMIDVDDEENSVSAKLDLARAYIEIDDEDNAKALLKEVQANGNDRQQAEASSLMKKLT
ncbi:FimV/HubP family polar landmark protein [Shewanella sp. HL-SH2]|uniref:FimV/HubP family polar landmark protein n=1 Tax=Shewanella sp. HL-SH2 TaxID=3436238 RepID=UPI003EBCED03